MPSILGSGGLFGSGLSILSIAKATSSVGLSQNARALNEKFLNDTRATGNALFSSGTASLTPKQLQTQILALRSKYSNQPPPGQFVDDSKLVLKSGKVGQFIDRNA